MRASNKAPVPRERIEKALLEELSKPGFTDVRAVMASVGLRSTSRLDKDFRDLRLAIAAKNATIKRRRLEASRTALITAIEAARATPCNEPPVPTVTEVAQRMGFATAEPLTSRFPELTTELQACRRRATQGKYRHRASERVRQRLTEALAGIPSSIVRRRRQKACWPLDPDPRRLSRSLAFSSPALWGVRARSSPCEAAGLRRRGLSGRHGTASPRGLSDCPVGARSYSAAAVPVPGIWLPKPCVSPVTNSRSSPTKLIIVKSELAPREPASTGDG